MHKNILFSILFTGCFITASSQTATHSLGASMPFGFRSYEVGQGLKNTDAYYMAQFSYGYRKNLSETEISSFSLGTIASLGGGLYSDIYGTGFLYSADLQLWGDFNKGMGAVAEPPKNSGFHAGIGAGISYTGADGESIDEDNGVSFGPMVRFGYRFGVYSTRKDVYKALGISLYYKHGLESAGWRIIGFHILSDL